MSRFVRIGDDEFVMTKASRRFLFLQGVVIGILIGFVLTGFIVRLGCP
jgi:uncharacterized oligopeptide transporter (OPT) family protein